MKAHLIWLTASMLALCGCSPADDVTVENAWLRATVAGQPVAGAYMEIISARDAQLVKVETPAARTAEIHSMEMTNGVMRMQALEALPLPAKQAVNLAPGGFHVMLMDLARPLQQGDSVPLKLTIREPGKALRVVSINAVVRPAAE